MTSSLLLLRPESAVDLLFLVLCCFAVSRGLGVLRIPPQGLNVCCKVRGATPLMEASKGTDLAPDWLLWNVTCVCTALLSSLRFNSKIFSSFCQHKWKTGQIHVNLCQLLQITDAAVCIAHAFVSAHPQSHVIANKLLPYLFV